MALESVTHISDLVITNPVGGSDPKSEGDDHIRNIKKALKTDFPNITGAMTATQAELNTMDGITATTAELNIMDGVTANATELNLLDTKTVIYDLVVLDTPEVLASGSLTQGAWTTINSTTLNTATAAKAIIRCYFSDSATGTGVLSSVSVRKTGSAVAFGTSAVLAAARDSASSSRVLSINAAGESVVNLDASYDFDYYYSTTATTNAVTITLVGYYV